MAAPGKIVPQNVEAYGHIVDHTAIRRMAQDYMTFVHLSSIVDRRIAAQHEITPRQ